MNCDIVLKFVYGQIRWQGIRKYIELLFFISDLRDLAAMARPIALSLVVAILSSAPIANCNGNVFEHMIYSIKGYIK